MTNPCIALLTDFGTTDIYAGVLRAVIAELAPGATTIDLTHAVPPGDIRNGAFQLWRSAHFFPAGTIFLCVVDPGVGTARRAIAVRFGAFTFVGPDNGLITYLIVGEQHPPAFELAAAEYRLERVSPTFHGRDIFAPAAAHLARGVSIKSMGPIIQDPVRIPLPRLSMAEEAKIEGEIVFIDGFGNLVTSIGRVEVAQGSLQLLPWLPGCQGATIPAQGWKLALPGGRTVRFGRTYEDVGRGEPLALVGSDGLIELAVHGGRADQALGLAVGQHVVFMPRE